MTAEAPFPAEESREMPVPDSPGSVSRAPDFPAFDEWKAEMDVFFREITQELRELQQVSGSGPSPQPDRAEQSPDGAGSVSAPESNPPEIARRATDRDTGAERPDAVPPPAPETGDDQALHDRLASLREQLARRLGESESDEESPRRTGTGRSTGRGPGNS